MQDHSREKTLLYICHFNLGCCVSRIYNFRFFEFEYSCLYWRLECWVWECAGQRKIVVVRLITSIVRNVVRDDCCAGFAIYTLFSVEFFKCYLVIYAEAGTNVHLLPVSWHLSSSSFVFNAFLTYSNYVLLKPFKISWCLHIHPIEICSNSWIMIYICVCVCVCVCLYVCFNLLWVKCTGNITGLKSVSTVLLPYIIALYTLLVC